MKLILAALAIAFAATASNPVRFSATTGDVSLSSSGLAATLQQAATAPGPQVTGEYVKIYCSVACTVTQTQNGVAATATLVPAVSINPAYGVVNRASFYGASNVSGGSGFGGILHVSAGQELIIDISKIRLQASGSQNNYTVAIASITGTANITVVWVEEQQ